MTEHRGTLPPGYELEEYRVESVLGRGGFGVTYLAHDSRLDQQVAIKEYLPCQFAVREVDSTVVPRSTADEAEFHRFLDRFLREARTLAKLRHPNIVRVLRYFEGLGTAYMVMEYERGKSLGQILRELTAPADSAWICGWLLPLLDGLAAVHAANFLHRDVKPDNIFVRTDGTPLLLDFGAARSVAGESSGLTTVYTAGYAPIEQYSPDGKQGPWTDIYGMAAVLYRIITGKPPIEAPLRSQNDALVPAVRAGTGRYDARLLAPIDWALRVDERARPQSVAEWRRGRDGAPGLDAVLCPEAPTVVAPELHDRSEPRRAGGRRWQTRAGAAVAMVVVVIAAALLVRLRSPTVPRVDDHASSAVGAPGGDAGGFVDVADSAISALGMVDGTDARYAANPELLMVDLRSDARQQVIEKAVGIFVQRGALLEHYESLAKEIFGRGELLERLVDDAQPRRSDDGLVYLPAAAEVRFQDLRKIVFRLSRDERLALISAQGDPLISVTVSVRDAERGSPIERSPLAENVIKQRIRDFGFRVASPRDAGSGDRDGGPRPDFAIESEAKLKTLRHTLPASGLTIEKYVLTSWTVKCTDRASDEDIYFDNRIPDSGSWADEDRALQEIGTLIADAFSRDFFAEHLPHASRNSRLAIHGVPSTEAAGLLRRELLGLRSVVHVATAPAGDGARFDVRWYDQGPGGEQSFDGTVLAPLRRKLGRDCLVAESDASADVAVRLSTECAHDLLTKLATLPAAALSEASAERLGALARSLETMRKLALLNPDGVNALAARGLPLARDALVPAAASRKIEL
ncbi:MAG: serine/threonine protein kinase [Deltaproteobacteria bacterium]|nr:serine/threonine protein kinase [Deltaproteobacteria bacterium]